jgi:hypothetical protein
MNIGGEKFKVEGGRWEVVELQGGDERLDRLAASESEGE